MTKIKYFLLLLFVAILTWWLTNSYLQVNSFALKGLIEESNHNSIHTWWYKCSDKDYHYIKLKIPLQNRYYRISTSELVLKGIKKQCSFLSYRWRVLKEVEPKLIDKNGQPLEINNP